MVDESRRDASHGSRFDGDKAGDGAHSCTSFCKIHHAFPNAEVIYPFENPPWFLDLDVCLGNDVISQWLWALAILHTSAVYTINSTARRISVSSFILMDNQARAWNVHNLQGK